MKKVYVVLEVAGVTGLAAYAFRDRLLAGMLGIMEKLQTMGLEAEEEELVEDPRTISFPKVEEDLDAR